MKDNQIPNINIVNIDDNPTVQSPSSPFSISFEQTRESLMDTEAYRSFLKNAESAFRKLIFYKHFKSELMDLGFDKSQMMGNITAEMVGSEGIEMNHFPIDLFSICVLITEHMLNTVNVITTFDLIKLLRIEHQNNNVGVCFLTSTEHQLYHNTDNFYISPRMVIGKWWHLLERYPYGLTQSIAYKLLFWIKESIENGDASNDNDLLAVRNNLINWSIYNQQRGVV